MKQIAIVTSAVLAGFLGGIGSSLVIHTWERGRPEQIVRARSFELLNENGQAVSFWGIDKLHNTMLAFGARYDEAVPSRRVAVDLRDPVNQTSAIGMMSDLTPFLRMRGPDRNVRVDLLLNAFDKPYLVLKDEAGPRVSLGFEGSDTPMPDEDRWSLIFEPDIVSIGVHSKKIDGQLYGQGYVYTSRDKVPIPR